MTVTQKEPLGETTLNRKWYMDVDVASAGAAQPTWVGVFGISDFTPKQNTTMQDDSDFDSDGYKSATATAIDWGCDVKLRRKTRADDPEEYDPGQEVLRLSAAELGRENSVRVRFYEVTPGGPAVEAYEGRASVAWNPDAGPMDALSTVSCVLTGQGKRVAIAHPGV